MIYQPSGSDDYCHVCEMDHDCLKRKYAGLEKIRLCCNANPVLVIENFNDPKNKKLRIQCPKCGMKTRPTRYYSDVVREWNNPENVQRFNYGQHDNGP